MGRKHRAAVMSYWAPLLSHHREGRALALAYAIADAVPDADDEWYGGQRYVAEVLGVWRGGTEFTDVARQAARRAVRRLVEVGLLEPLDEASGTSPGTYRCRWKQPPVWPTGGPL